MADICTFVMKTFMYGCKFNFGECVRNAREKATKCATSPNCFNSHTKSWCLDFFKKNVFPDVRSEIHLSDITSFLPDLQNLSGLTKNIYSGLGKLQIWTFFTQWWQLESLPDHVCVRGLEFISLWAYRSLVSVLKIRLLRLLYNFISILGIVVKIVMSKQR